MDCSGSPPNKKKRKKRELELVDSSPAPADTVIPWTICCLDGTTFSIAVPEGAPVAELKCAIGLQRKLLRCTMELFVKGVEDALDDEKLLRTLGDRVPLFLLMKQASDRLALDALFKSTGGADWTNKAGWMTDAELGDRHGVTVNAEGRVIALDLSENGLAGALPSDILQLSALRSLDLATNELTGPIPGELGQLGALLGLFLHENQFSGPIPVELGQLGALTSLYLARNQLSGLWSGTAGGAEGAHPGAQPAAIGSG